MFLLNPLLDIRRKEGLRIRDMNALIGLENKHGWVVKSTSTICYPPSLYSDHPHRQRRGIESGTNFGVKQGFKSELWCGAHLLAQAT